MREITAVRQDAPGLIRRWYQDDYMDLFVWCTESLQICAFQLSYDRSHSERMVEWSSTQGFQHKGVDSGEGSPLKNMAPMLIDAPATSVRPVWREFERRSRMLDPAVRAFVLSKLRHACRLRRLTAHRGSDPHAD
jgi:hypothetical protein